MFLAEPVDQRRAAHPLPPGPLRAGQTVSQAAEAKPPPQLWAWQYCRGDEACILFRAPAVYVLPEAIYAAFVECREAFLASDHPTLIEWRRIVAAQRKYATDAMSAKKTADAANDRAHRALLAGDDPGEDEELATRSAAEAATFATRAEKLAGPVRDARDSARHALIAALNAKRLEMARDANERLAAASRAIVERGFQSDQIEAMFAARQLAEYVGGSMQRTQGDVPGLQESMEIPDEPPEPGD
jgi:hypothetical protein